MGQAHPEGEEAPSPGTAALMQIKRVTSDGWVNLGAPAQGYHGRDVQISVLSTGSVLITLDDTPVLIDIKPRLIPPKHKELSGG
jgi:hypothetical protein